MRSTKLFLVLCLLSQSGSSEDLAAQDSIPGYVLLPPPSQLQPHLYQQDFRTVWTREDAQSAPIHQWSPQQNYQRNPAVQLDSQPFSAPERQHSDERLLYSSVPPPPVAHYATQKPHQYGQQYLRQEVHNPYLTTGHHQASREAQDHIPHGTQLHIPHGKLVLTLASDPNFEQPVEHYSPSQDSSQQPEDKSNPELYPKPKSLATLLAENIARNKNPELHHYSENQKKLDSSRVLPPQKEEGLEEYHGEIDHLYDEFVHMYYDDEVPEEEEGKIEESVDAHRAVDLNTKFSLDVLETPSTPPEASDQKLNTTPSTNIKDYTHEVKIPETKPPQIDIEEGESTHISTSQKTSIEPQSTTATPRQPKEFSNTDQTEKQPKSNKPSSSSQTAYRTKPRIRPLSLSEVIQKMDLNLPSFLVALQSHGKSLKDVTYQLTQIQLTKTDFRRIRGDVGRLLETLEETVPTAELSTTITPVTTAKSVKTTVDTKPVHHFTKPPRTTRKSDTRTTSEKTTENHAITTTTEQSTTLKQISLSPRIFGSKPSGSSITMKNQHVKPKTGGTASISFPFDKKDDTGFLQGFEKIFNITSDMVSNEKRNNKNKVSSVSDWASVSPKPYAEVGERHRTTAEPKRTTWKNYVNDRKLVNSRFGSTKRPSFRPSYVIPSSPRPGSFFEESEEQDLKESTDENADDVHTFKNPSIAGFRPHLPRPATNINDRRRKYKIDAHNADVATKSAILAAVILGSVALTVFIAIFIVVRYKSHRHKRKRRKHLSLHSDSSTSSIPPLYATRGSLYRSSYHSSGFWNSLKRKFDPYSISDSPMSDR